MFLTVASAEKQILLVFSVFFSSYVQYRGTFKTHRLHVGFAVGKIRHHCDDVFLIVLSNAVKSSEASESCNGDIETISNNALRQSKQELQKGGETTQLLNKKYFTGVSTD